MKIRVTKKDIKDGTTWDPFNCPITIAAKRAFRKTNWLTVRSKHLRFVRDNGDVKAYILPPKARRFIKNFDNLEPVKPFDFVAEHVKSSV